MGQRVKMAVSASVGAYLGIAVVTAAIAGPASKLACQASTPLRAGDCVLMGALWPLALPGLVHALRYPER